MTLEEAIAGVQTAKTALSVTETAKTEATARFAAAQVAKRLADDERAAAATSFNTALDDLALAVGFAKVTV